MKKIISLFILIGLLSACTRDESTYIKETALTGKKNVSASVDTIRIAVDSIGLNSYSDMSYFRSAGREYLLGSNAPRTCLDLFDLTSRKLLKHIFIKDTKGLITEIKGVKVVDFDNILVMVPGKLITTDSSGGIKQYTDLYKIMATDFEILGDPAVQRHFPLNYLSSEQGATTLFYANRTSSDYAGKDVVLEYDHGAKKFALLPIKYSPYFADNDGKFGYLTYVNLGEAAAEYVYYNFLFESNIYRFNRKTGEIDVFGGEVPDVLPLASTLEDADGDEQKWTVHAIENPHYFRPLYDPYHKLIYRPVWKDLEYQRADSYFNNFIDKDLVISVFDDQMRLVHNHTLPPMRYAIHNWFVSQGGLVLSPTHPENKNVDKNTLELHVFRFTN